MKDYQATLLQLPDSSFNFGFGLPIETKMGFYSKGDELLLKADDGFLKVRPISDLGDNYYV